MGIKSNKQQGRIYVSPLSIQGEIIVLSGSPVQTYDKQLREYSPDRTLTPLVIVPKVSAFDEKTVFGEMELTGVEWFEGAPRDKSANRIVNNEYYTISDGSGDIPKYALIIRKNTSPEAPVEYFGIAIFTDPRTNREVRCERSVKSYAHLYDNKAYSLRLKGDSVMVTDPLRLSDRSGYWNREIEPQLYTGTEPVDDEHAAYFWDILENGAYRPVTPDDPGIVCHDGNGVYTRKLMYQAKYVTGASFRCRACEYAGSRPQAPTDGRLEKVIEVKTEMAASLNCEIIQTKGFTLPDDMKQPSAYEVRIFDNRREYGTEYDDLFRITWKGQSAKPGEPEKVLATGGRTLEFIPADKGFPAGHIFQVWAEVGLLTGESLMGDEEGAVISSQIDGQTVFIATGPVYE